MIKNAVALIKARKRLLFIALFLALTLLAVDRYAAFMHSPEPDSTRIVIYTTAWCPYCKMLRQDLAASQVSYTEYDVETSAQGQLGMWILRGRGVPVSVIGPKVVYGYRVDEIASALKPLGYSFIPSAYKARVNADDATIKER
ncbi:MAG TPA: glutaredoxin family protein [Burkholderiales bacterium]|jgi:glutaredoxin|nr:glutaredoxin family protein [Burkholderiales bacterium]